MTIQNVYNQFNIFPSLQTHMLRVAAFTQEVYHQLGTTRGVDKKALLSVALLHDLGNIVKFDTTLLPELFEPQGVDYRSQVKSHTIEKYSFIAEETTLAMCKEMDLSTSVTNLLKAMLISHFTEAPEGTLSPEVLILHFADMNIGIQGYLSWEQRIKNLRDRNIRNKGYTEKQADTITQSLLQAGAYTTDLFRSSGRDSSIITTKSIDRKAEALRSFTL